MVDAVVVINFVNAGDLADPYISLSLRFTDDAPSNGVLCVFEMTALDTSHGADGAGDDVCDVVNSVPRLSSWSCSVGGWFTADGCILVVNASVRLFVFTCTGGAILTGGLVVTEGSMMPFVVAGLVVVVGVVDVLLELI